MKTEELKSRGLTDEQINYVMAENGKDLRKLQEEVKKLSGERGTLKERAENAEATLSKFDGIDVEKIKQEVEDWKEKARTAEENAKNRLYERDFADALKGELESVRFTSEAAKRDVMAQINAAGLKLKDGKILGLSDLLEQIRKADAAAFVDEHQERLEENKARFTAPHSQYNGANAGSRKLSEMTLDERMRMKASDPEYYKKLQKGE